MTELYTTSDSAQIAECQMLTFDTEQRLFKRLSFLRLRANAIQVALHAGKPNKKKHHELERLLAESTLVREELASGNLRLVASIARRLSKSSDEYDEFYAEGNSILMYVIDQFDYTRGFRFSTYLTHAIQRHLYRVINRQRKRSDREFACEPEAMINEATSRSEADEIERSEMRQVASMIAERIDEVLDNREQFIIRSRFGLNDSGKAQSYSELSTTIGLSKERVRQISIRSLEKLRNFVKHLDSTFAPI